MLRKRVWLNTPWGNYSDKKKHLLTPEEIEQYKMYEENNIAFDFGDFINSGCVTKPTLSILNKQPNYMILYDGNEIEARYYVTSFTYVAGEPKNENAGTYEATLHRDLIIDYKDDIKNNLFKCERGYLDRNTWSPILVQPEGLSLNRIKKAQIPIKLWDDNAQWLTIFYDTGRDSNIEIQFDQSSLLTPDMTLEEVNNVYISKEFQAPVYPSNEQIYKRVPSNLHFKIKTSLMNISGWASWVKANISFHSNFVNIQVYDSGTGFLGPSVDTVKQKLTQYANALVTEIWNRQDSIYSIDKSNGYSEIRNTLNNKIVNNNEIISVLKIRDEHRELWEEDANDSLKRLINNEFKIGTLFRYDGYDIKFELESNIEEALDTENMITTFTQVSGIAKIILPATVTSPRLDEIYLGCITIPFGENVKVKNGSNTYELSDWTIKSLATKGWSISAGDVIKDIQILPYCPCNKLNQEYNNNNPNSIIDATFLNDSYKIPITLTANDTVLSYGFVCDQSSMNYRYSIDLSSYFSNDIKMDSITKSMRLCSHNHKQSFEMNPTLNNGVDSLSFECTLRPLNTIYHICPIFKELYGGNYEDVRGLVWEGGFSLPFVSNAWTEYRLQNSTYKELFDRDVKNYEINANTARGLEELNIGRSVVNGIIGGITGASAIDTITSGKTGSLFEKRQRAKGQLSTLTKARELLEADSGKAAYTSAINRSTTALANANKGLIGAGIAAAGGIAMGVSNAIFSGKALDMHNKLRDEDLAYKKDTWNLQMQAIEARPNTVATSTEYSILNYYKAYIEIYDCTEIEKEFINKALSYKSMKIGQIGYINDFVLNDNCYVEGNLIFMQGQTPLIANAVNEELKSGIYVQEGLFN